MGDEGRAPEIEASLRAEGLGVWFDNEPRAATHFPDWLVVAVPLEHAHGGAGSANLLAHGDTNLEALERLAALVFDGA